MKKKNKKKIWLVSSIILTIIVASIIGIVIHNMNNNPEHRYEKVKERTIGKSSTKIDGVHKLEGLEIKNIEALVEKGETKIMANVYNPTMKEGGDIDITMRIVTQEGDKVVIKGYIPNISPESSANIISTVNKELKNVKQIEFKTEEL